MFAGQRAEGFYVDLGAIFDLGILRPFQQLAHDVRPPEHRARGDGGGRELDQGCQRALDRDRGPEDGRSRRTARSRPTPTAAGLGDRRLDDREPPEGARPQGRRHRRGVRARTCRSRASATRWSTKWSSRWRRRTTGTRRSRSDDKQFTPAVLNPELAQLLPVLYPGVFPNLEAYNKGTPKRDDLVAIFHTGLPAGVVAGFQNSMGTVQADMLRLNLAVPVDEPGCEQPRADRQRPRRLPERPSRVRRRHDDRAARARRRHAAARRQVVHARRTPRARSHPGSPPDATDTTAMGTENYLLGFPYLGTPYSGFAVPAA